MIPWWPTIALQSPWLWKSTGEVWQLLYHPWSANDETFEKDPIYISKPRWGKLLPINPFNIKHSSFLPVSSTPVATDKLLLPQMTRWLQATNLMVGSIYVLCRVQCSMCTLCNLYCVQFFVCNVRCAICAVWWTVLCAMFNLHFVRCGEVFCATCSVLSQYYCVKFEVRVVQCLVYNCILQCARGSREGVETNLQEWHCCKIELDSTCLSAFSWVTQQTTNQIKTFELEK